MREILKELALDWTNNYLTIEKIAEHHDISVEDMVTLISMGKRYHEKDVEHTQAILQRKQEEDAQLLKDLGIEI